MITNRHTGLCITCPITNTRRDYPFHWFLRAGRAKTKSLRGAPDQCHQGNV